MSEPREAPVRKAPDDHAVAWQLAAAAHPHLNRVDADRIYIDIGVGDTFDAIAALLTVIARDHIPLGADLTATVAGWLDCYRGQEAEPRLRDLLSLVTPNAPSSAPVHAVSDAVSQRRAPAS